jgi:hypothetical protein
LPPVSFSLGLADYSERHREQYRNWRSDFGWRKGFPIWGTRVSRNLVFARQRLSIDNLLDAEVILASGEIVHANANENTDLFWALRGTRDLSISNFSGAGPNFGVVTEFTFQAYDQENAVWSGVVIYTPDKIPDVVKAVEEFRKNQPTQSALAIGIGCAPGTAIPTILISPFWNGSEEKGRQLYKPFFDIGPMVEMMESRPYVKQA